MSEREAGKKLPARKSRYKPLKNGLWAKDLAKGVDMRTQIGRWIVKLRAELRDHVGGAPSIAELILIDRICSKVVRCRLYESGLFKDTEGRMTSRDHFLALENGLRHDLTTLGMKAKLKPMKSLGEYLLQKDEIKGDGQ